jgi:hypothetical protein
MRAAYFKKLTVMNYFLQLKEGLFPPVAQGAARNAGAA